MKGKRKTQDPCPGCFLHKSLCLCAEIPKIKTKTRLSLIIHHKELRRTTNTGVLATQALINSEIHVRGLIDHPLNILDLVQPGYQPVLFFPCEEALELTPEWVSQWSQPLQLFVPDGNWRQASKVHYRHSEIKDFPRVMIKAASMAASKSNTRPNTELSTENREFLRKEHSEFGMATLQAIAKALGKIEGAEIESQLLKLYQIKLDRTLFGRGKKTTYSFGTS